MATFTILHANSYILNLIHPQLRPQSYASTATHTILCIHSYTHNNALHPQLQPQSYTITATFTMTHYIHSYTHNPEHP